MNIVIEENEDVLEEYSNSLEVNCKMSWTILGKWYKMKNIN